MPTSPKFGLIVLYVKDVAISAAFYRDLLGAVPVESSATFAMFPMPPVMLGLWARTEVKPEASGSPGALEIDFRVADAQAVRDTHAEWVKKGLTIVQAPVELDFGFTFMAVDPDGHKLRVMAPN